MPRRHLGIHMKDKREYYRRVFVASGKDVFKVLTKEDRAIVASLTVRDQELFLEDPNCRYCIIRRE